MEQSDKTYKDEIRESIQAFVKRVIGWFTFRKGENLLMYLLHLIWKIPALLIMLILSPFLFIILVFTFVVVA